MSDENTQGSSGSTTGNAGDNPAAERAGIFEKPSEEEQQQIQAEREERLDPDNRPANAEVDNTDRTFEDGGFKD